MKKVLIALDYNPTAQKVAELGFILAKSMGAEVTLLHVMAHPIYYSTEEFSPIMGFSGFLKKGPLSMNSIESLKKASVNFLKKSKQYLGDNTIHIIVEEGDASEAILKAAKNLQADIIVIGSHSSRWLEDIFMGSVTEKVLKHTTIPLYIIPTKNNNKLQK